MICELAPIGKPTSSISDQDYLTYPGSIFIKETPSGDGDIVSSIAVAAAGQADRPDVVGIGNRRVHDKNGNIVVLQKSR